MPACALCLKDTELRLSHVLPEFSYGHMYDEMHRALSIDADIGRVRFEQRGLRERLLCEECEQHFSRLESYFARVWHQAPVFPEPFPAEGFVATSLDYRLFKLFHLSVLWRCHVSSLPAFQGVALGPHAEAIRKRLVALDPGPADLYPLGASAVLREDGQLERGLFIPYGRIRVDGHSLFLGLYSGFEWVLKVSSHAWPGSLLGTLSHDGTLHVKSRRRSELSYVYRFLQRFKQAQAAGPPPKRRPRRA